MSETRTSTGRAAFAIGLAVVAATAAAPAARAQTVPSVMNYQGRLTDNTPQQAPINAAPPMTFRIFDAAVGGTELWTESWPVVPVVNGIFSLLLGSNGAPIPASLFTGGTTRFLEVTINGETLTPRQQLGTAGWAVRAETAASTDCDGCVSSPQIANGSIAAADIAADAVGAPQIASGAVGSSEILAGAVGASKIAADAVNATHIATDSVGNSELNGAEQFVFTGGIVAEAPGAELISRFGGTSRLELHSEAPYSYLWHPPTGSFLLVDDATGNWGIGTAIPQDRLHVSGSVRANALVDANNASFLVDPAGTSTMATLNATSLDLSGTAFVGYQIISTSYPVDTEVASCPTYGGLACRIGSGCAVCPAGTVVIGGGCNASSAQWGQVGASRPSGSTQWCCETSYDLSGSDTAYAICARIGN